MQELIEELERVKSMTNMNFVIKVATDLLEKEKEQIINAYTNAYLIGEDDISVEDANKESEQYYKQTYNQNK